MDKTVRLNPFKTFTDDTDQGSDTCRAIYSYSSKADSTPKFRLSMPSMIRTTAYISPRLKRKQSLASRQADQISLTHREFAMPKVVKASHDISTPSLKSKFKKACSTTNPETILLKNRKVSKNLILDCFPNCN
ncbi:unnamed protein product [Blepharisma stoltei]|uniref:Uncharacterized protein n=1 Tax=Blepharisma stoltei TaxID=1481888 RepID=A0AAU9JQZ1_9CILI|nr:unnamed protein product [Blepharisma stoltei]